MKKNNERHKQGGQHTLTHNRSHKRYQNKKRSKKKKKRNNPATPLIAPLVEEDPTASAKENVDLAILALIASSFYALAGAIGFYLAWKEWISPRIPEEEELIV